MNTAESGPLGLEAVADAIEDLRAAALKSMRQWRIWRGVDDAQLEDYFQDVAAVLLTRPLQSREHVRRALYQELGFRSKRHWQLRKRHPETPTDDFRVFDAVDQQTDDGPTYQQAEDCLAELTERQAAIFRLHRGEGRKRKAVARQLGITEAEVLKDLYAATNKIAQFTVVLEAGRACGKRAAAIQAYVAGRATGEEVRRARAHLAACEPCLLAYRRVLARVESNVAALVPVPLLLGGGLLDRVLAIAHGRPSGGRLDALRETAVGAFIRQPANAEALTAGAGGAGMAVGAKLAAGACITVVAAGGTALCGALGVLPAGVGGGHRSHTHVHKSAPSSEPAPVTGAQATARLRPPGQLGAMPSPRVAVERRLRAPQRQQPNARGHERRTAPAPSAAASTAVPTHTDFAAPGFENGLSDATSSATPRAVAAAPPPQPAIDPSPSGGGDFTETFENGSQ